MNLLETMLHRRSTRTYTGDHVTKEQLDKVLAAGQSGASGKALYPWQFVVVQNRDTIALLADSRERGAGNTVALADAVIAVFGNAQKSDIWIEDCSGALSNMHLMADSLGLASCWIQGRLRLAKDGRSTDECVRELLGVPSPYHLEGMLALGVPKAHPAPHTLDDVDQSKIHWEHF